jgi:dihydrolipoamide dehydrogenase
MPEDTFDLAVIGSGPGGYVAAIRAAQLGLNTAIIEKDKFLGGTCLNVGCIPSKALLHSTEMYHFAAHESSAHGINTGEVSMDIATLMKKKTGVVNTLRRGVETLVKKRKIAIFKGHGKLLGEGKIEIKSEKDSEEIIARNIILATGSKVAELPFLKCDGELVVSSDDAIAFESVPEKLIVIGGGAIGLELGSVWSRLGSDVTIVEFLPRIAATYDPDITQLAERIFKKQGMKIETAAKVTGVKINGDHAIVSVEKKGKTLEFTADKVLLSVGRVPYSEGLGLEEVGVKKDDRGRIITDESFRTNVEGVYAIGDTIEGPMLAHKAEEEGVAAAEIIAGKAGHVNYKTIPNVIYTEPEMASVGISEEEAKEQKLDTRIGKFPLAANGRAIASGTTDGMVKVIADAVTDRILGVQVISHNASELIAAAVVHMEYCGSAEDMARTVTAHPTLSESLKEAAMAVDKTSIHSL